jgi:hypothetical protein
MAEDINLAEDMETEEAGDENVVAMKGVDKSKINMK